MGKRKIVLRIILFFTTIITLSITNILAASKHNEKIILQCNWGTNENQLGYCPEEMDGEGFLNPAEGPRSFGVDKEGNIYIADILKNRVVKFNNKGEYLASFGWFTGKDEAVISTFSGRKVTLRYKSHFYPQLPLSILGGPNDVAVDSKGYVYVTTEESDNYVFKFTPNGMLVALIDQFGPYSSKDIWGVDLKSTNDGGIMVGFSFKGKRMPHKKLFFDNNGNFLGENIGQPDGLGKRYNIAPETKEAISTGKEKNEYLIEVLEPDAKTRSHLIFPFKTKEKELWFETVDQEGVLYFVNPKEWKLFKIDHKGKIKKEIPLLKYSAPMGMNKPYIISPQGEIYQMLPSSSGLQIIKFPSK